MGAPWLSCVVGRNGYKNRPFGSDLLMQERITADLGWGSSGYRAVCQRMITVVAARYTPTPIHGGNSGNPWEGEPRPRESLTGGR
jgi:hypothetical protein